MVGSSPHISIFLYQKRPIKIGLTPFLCFMFCSKGRKQVNKTHIKKGDHLGLQFIQYPFT